jgi:hypothetical protein
MSAHRSPASNGLQAQPKESKEWAQYAECGIFEKRFVEFLKMTWVFSDIAVLVWDWA